MIDPVDSEAPRASADRAPPPPRAIPAARLRRIGLVAAAIGLLIAAGGIVRRELESREVARWTDAEAIPSVSIVAPQRGGIGRQLDLPGNIKAWYEASIYARVSGYLKQWYFDYGAHVKAGQVLAVIDTPDLDAQYAAAAADLNAARANVNVSKAEMDFAKTTYVRWRDSPKGVVSVQETESKKADYESAVARYDAAMAGVKSDEGAVDRLRALEKFKLLVAPFDGIVTARNTDIGALINAGSGAGAGSAPELFRVADVHEMRVFVQVPQSMSGGIVAGMTADLALPQYPERVFKAVVATTSGSIDRDSRALLVELYASNPGGLLQPGTYTEVHFNLAANPNGLTIPATALVFRQAGMQVAVVDPHGRAELKSVTLGRNFGTDVQILTGLSPSDRVIDSPPDSLSDGEPVRVVNPLLPNDGDFASATGAAADRPGHGDPLAGHASAAAPPDAAH